MISSRIQAKHPTLGAAQKPQVSEHIRGEAPSEHKRSWIAALDANAERYLLLIFYTTVVVTITVEVLRRSLFDYSSIWGEEVARYAFIYLSWVGAAQAVKDRCHIRIDFVLTRLSQRGKAIFSILGDLATLVLAVVAFWTSLHPIATSLEYGSVTHGLRISLAVFLAAVPCGFALIVVRLLQSIRRDWGCLQRGEPVPLGTPLFD